MYKRKIAGSASKARPRAPMIDPKLIEWLEELFPDRLPESVDISQRALGALVGQQNVMRVLRNEYRRQSSNTDIL